VLRLQCAWRLSEIECLRVCLCVCVSVWYMFACIENIGAARRWLMRISHMG